MVTQALYLYGVARRTAQQEGPLRCPGVEPGAWVTRLPFQDLEAVVSAVPLNDYLPARVEERLQGGDTRWVEERALAHAAVLQEMLNQGPVVPVRFGTLFRDVDRLLAALTDRAEAILRALDQLAGRLEWGVTVLWESEALTATLLAQDATAAGLQERLEGMPPGTAYLHTKRLERLLEERARQIIPEWSSQIHAALAGASEAARTLEVRASRETDRAATVLHAAYLVREEQWVRFRAELEGVAGRLKPQGLRLGVTGPWPPYHFTEVRLDETTA